MEKPKIKFSDLDGNVFALISRAKHALRDADQKKRADEMYDRAWYAHSYDQAFRIISEYCDIE